MGVDFCDGCRNNVENLPEHIQDAISELPFDQWNNMQIGLCDGCSLASGS